MVFDFVDEKFQPARRSNLICIEKAATLVQVFGLVRLAFVHSEEFVIAEHLVKHSHQFGLPAVACESTRCDPSPAKT
jgi:hypothetical protein